jgi:hypothetical protein
MAVMVGKRGYYGELVIEAIDRKGNRFRYITPNTLTNEAARLCSHLLVGDDTANLSVIRLGIGTGTTPPERTDTSLEAEVHQQAVDAFSYPQVGQVEFQTIVEFIAPANGEMITEAGLIAGNGTSLFSRQVHTAIPKDENFRLEYRWRIVFT